MIRGGVTGGIGSGKSTVSAILARHGAQVIDADAIARSVTAAGGTAIEPIRQAFGVGVIGTDGALDRAAMRAIVFADPAARQRLESIIHPLVGSQTERASRTAEDAGCRCLVYDVPLLVESGERWRRRVDQVLVVDCTAETQIRRVMDRSGLGEPEVRAIMAQQATRSQRLTAADLVLYNEHRPLSELESEVQAVLHHFGL